MKLLFTQVKDVIILEPQVFTDSRGWFFDKERKKTNKSTIEKLTLYEN